MALAAAGVAGRERFRLSPSAISLGTRRGRGRCLIMGIEAFARLSRQLEAMRESPLKHLQSKKEPPNGISTI